MKKISIRMFLLFGVLALMFASSGFTAEKSTVFSGAKVNGGTVSFSKEMGKRVLTLSADFQKKIDTPDPHWRVVDSMGNTYLLDRFEVKDMKTNRTITVPDNVPDIAKVQFWCAFAEVVLGEASFAAPMK